MNVWIQKLRIACFTLVVLIPGFSQGQDLTGIWKGYFTTNTGSHYKLEFQVEQNKSKSVNGVSYSWGTDINFYGKATMTGRYATDTKTFTIQEIRTIEVKSAGGGTCIMNYRLTYTRSGKEEYLEGTYVGKNEDRFNPKNNGVWGDCGGGNVFLRRVQSSDFYLEPFLRDKPEPVQKDTVVKKPSVPVIPKPETKPQNKPQATVKKPVTKPPAKQTVPAKKPAKDSVIKTPEVIVEKPVETPVDKPKIQIPPTTRARQNELAQTLTLTSEEISVRLYDNGDVDDDTISVYLDGKVILSNKRLSTVPISIKLKLDEDNPEHVLIMVAENLGRIPPNTSLMIVQDGDKRYQVSITSTEQKNAMVRFRYQKKKE